MRPPAWFRRLRYVWRRRRAAPRPTGRTAAEQLARAGKPGGDTLSDALLRLRRTIDDRRLDDLPMAWFRVDEAKATAVWYSINEEPAHPAVLAEEEALAERALRQAAEGEFSEAGLLTPARDVLPMVRYRLLTARLPAAVAAGGKVARAHLDAVYGLMARMPDVLSPYGRWLLASTVCRAARDKEELARQTERFRLVTTDHRGADGSAMVFVSGGEFDLPLPLSLTQFLDLPGMPPHQEAFKREAPKDVARLFLALTERSRQVFLRAFQRREEAYLTGRPWGKPPHLTDEGFVFVRQRVSLPAFFLDRQPVTNEQYCEFTLRHAVWRPSRVPRYAVDRDTYLPHWSADAPPRGSAGEPVTGVSYQACRAYLAAAGKQMPTEAQWVLALVGRDVPEVRLVGVFGRPTMTDEERAVYGRRAAERGLHLLLPERNYDFDGCCNLLPYDAQRVLFDPSGPGHGRGHVWRAPTARGRVPDVAGDANLTFRGVLPASRVWTAP